MKLQVRIMNKGNLRKPCRQGVAEARKAKFIGINERIRVRRNAVYGVSGGCLNVIVLALCVSFMNISCGISRSEDFPASGIREYRDEYVNGDYAFSVKIPTGLVGTGADYYAPDHGFVREPLKTS